MSKARLVITALFVDHQSPAEVAARYGVHRAWVYKLKARYEAEGEAALEPRSRRPKTIPTATPPASWSTWSLRLRKQLTDAGLDAGADTIGWHLSHHHGTEPVAGHHQPDPGPRRHGDPGPVEAAEVVLHPVRSRPAERVLAVRLHPLPAHPPRRPPRAPDAGDHQLARRPLPLRPARHRPRPGHRTDRACRPSGKPLTCTDTQHPRSPTTAWCTPPACPARPRRAAATRSSPSCTDSTSSRRTARPNHPTTCGKVERFQQTLKKWLRAQRPQPTTHRRAPDPPRPFPTSTTTAARTAPSPTGPPRPPPTQPDPKPPRQRPTTDTHDRIRNDKINKAGTVTLRVAGRLRHIGVGRTYAGTYVLLLVQDLDVRVVDAATGELLRELTIDPRRDYQPTGAPKDPPEMTTPDLRIRRSAVADVLRHHTGRADSVLAQDIGDRCLTT